MVSFSFGKKRRMSRDKNRPGYSKKQYLSSTGRFRHPHTRMTRKRSVLDPVPASDLDFGRRRRRSSMYFGASSSGIINNGMGTLNPNINNVMGNLTGNTWNPPMCPSGKKISITSACKFGRRSRRRMPCVGRRRRRSSMYFGKKRKVMRRRVRTGCGVHRKRGMCITANGCSWKKKSRRCVKRRSKVARVSKSAPMGDADDNLAAYDAEAGFTWMGRRRRRRMASFGRRKSRKVSRRKTSRRKTSRRKISRRKISRRKTSRRKVSRRKVSRRKTSRRKVNKKLPAKIRKMCKRLKIKCTKKVGNKKVYKKLSVVKRQIARRMRTMRKRARRSRR